MFEATVRDEILQLRCPETRWLSTGWNGGEHTANVAYNISVPEGWKRTDIDDYIAERLADAAFEEDGPTLLTGVDMKHLRGARLGPAVVYATAGVSNPAALPVDQGSLNGETEPRPAIAGSESGTEPAAQAVSTDKMDRQQGQGNGTVNLIVGVDRQLSAGGRANLLTVVAEAKAATLLGLVGIPGTTTDAVIVGHSTEGDTVEFTGSATPVGESVRACVREALAASLASRYADTPMPQSVVEAEYGVTTDQQAEVFLP